VLQDFRVNQARMAIPVQLELLATLAAQDPLAHKVNPVLLDTLAAQDQSARSVL
jgi:hypothetical protein